MGLAIGIGLTLLTLLCVLAWLKFLATQQR